MLAGDIEQGDFVVIMPQGQPIHIDEVVDILLVVICLDNLEKLVVSTGMQSRSVSRSLDVVRVDDVLDVISMPRRLR